MAVKEASVYYGKMNDEEAFIMSFLKANAYITRLDVQEKLNVGQTKAGLILKSLLDKQLIIRQGKGKNTYYSLSR